MAEDFAEEAKKMARAVGLHEFPAPPFPKMKESRESLRARSQS